MSPAGAGSERARARELDRRILALIEGARDSWSVSDGQLNRLALDIFTYQCEFTPAYRRFAEARGRSPQQVENWRQLPPIPARVFKNLRLATFSPAATRRVFRSSGTTQAQRATIELDTLELYDAALVPTIARFLFPDDARLTWLALLPNPDHVTDSSLGYMVGRAAQSLATRVLYLAPEGHLDLRRTTAELEKQAAAGEPVAVLGTAFGFVHLLDHLRQHGRRLTLAGGSRLMETGGFKGRSRSVERAELYQQLAEGLGLELSAIVGEYGMTEMGSQLYDDTLRRAWSAQQQPAARHRPQDVEGTDQTRWKQAPPWVRTQVVDPVSLEPVAVGEPGVLVHLDLTGRGTALKLLTADRGRLTPRGLEFLGRLPGVEPRGCSLAYEEILRFGTDP